MTDLRSRGLVTCLPQQRGPRYVYRLQCPQICQIQTHLHVCLSFCRVDKIFTGVDQSVVDAQDNIPHLELGFQNRAVRLQALRWGQDFLDADKLAGFETPKANGSRQLELCTWPKDNTYRSQNVVQRKVAPAVPGSGNRC